MLCSSLRRCMLCCWLGIKLSDNRAIFPLELGNGSHIVEELQQLHTVIPDLPNPQIVSCCGY